MHYLLQTSSVFKLETNSTLPHTLKLPLTSEILDVYSNIQLSYFESKPATHSRTQKLHHLNKAFSDQR